MEVIRVEPSNGNQPWFRRLKIKNLSGLRDLLISEHCFRYVEDLTLSNLSALERFIVGEYCFGQRNTPSDIESSLEYDSLTIEHCDHLKELYFHNYSFQDYSSFRLVGMLSSLSFIRSPFS